MACTGRHRPGRLGSPATHNPASAARLARAKVTGGVPSSDVQVDVADRVHDLRCRHDLTVGQDADVGLAHRRMVARAFVDIDIPEDQSFPARQATHVAAQTEPILGAETHSLTRVTRCLVGLQKASVQVSADVLNSVVIGRQTTPRAFAAPPHHSNTPIGDTLTTLRAWHTPLSRRPATCVPSL